MTVTVLDAGMQNGYLDLRAGLGNGTEWFNGDSCLGFSWWEGAVCFTKCGIFISCWDALISNEVSG